MRLGGEPGIGCEPLLVGVEPREAAHEADGVGMLRVREDLVHVSQLDDASGVHDDDAIGELGDEAEVVGDEEGRRVRSRSGRPSGLP